MAMTPRKMSAEHMFWNCFRQVCEPQVVGFDVHKRMREVASQPQIRQCVLRSKGTIVDQSRLEAANVERLESVT